MIMHSWYLIKIWANIYWGQFYYYWLYVKLERWGYSFLVKTCKSTLWLGIVDLTHYICKFYYTKPYTTHSIYKTQYSQYTNHNRLYTSTANNDNRIFSMVFGSSSCSSSMDVWNRWYVYQTSNNLQCSQRHSVINHCDRRSTHLGDLDYIFWSV